VAGKVGISERGGIEIGPILVVVGMGLVVMLAAATGDSERVTGLWAGAEISDDGGARVTEVIDYGFGGESRHGIFRDVPGLSPEAAVTVSSATAPDQVELVGMGSQTRIRIGDPDRTVGGRHRYRLQYPLTGLAPNGKVAWDAVGTGWPVDLSRIEIHLVAPFEFTAPSCVQGQAGSRQPCEVTAPEPGHLVIRIDELGAGKGATLYASAGRPLAGAPNLPVPQSGAVADARISWLLPGLLAALVALVVTPFMFWSVRRAGRERVATGGPVGGGWGATGARARVDAAGLAESVEPGFGPPEELTPAQGGILFTGSVDDRHKLAWLISAAVDGYLDIETDGPHPTLVRRTPPAAAPPALRTVALLDRLFGGRDRVLLGFYDPRVAAAWKALGKELNAWRRTCGLWVVDRRRLLTRLGGFIAAPLGLIVAFAGGILANFAGSGWQAYVTVGTVGACAGLTLLIRARKLRPVLTPAGSALRTRVESFRRFLADSDPHHADQAAAAGRLGQYTAWAVALGQTSSWSRALTASTVPPSDIAPFVHGSALSWAVSASSTAPSSTSSGSGGGDGGSAGGGGGGGGGGGSW
jgi:hypothetical protein